MKIDENIISWPTQFERTLENHTSNYAGHKTNFWVDLYKDSTWRMVALNTLQSTDLSTEEVLSDKDKFKSLVTNNPEFTAPSSFSEALEGPDQNLLMLLIVEWRFILFEEEMSEDNWLKIIRPIENFWDAKIFLTELIVSATKDNNFKIRFKQFCSDVFSSFKKNPAPNWPADRPEKGALTNLISEWKSNPTFEKLSWVEREIGYLFPFSDDLGLTEHVLSFEVNLASDLLEGFENPYQPMGILINDLHLADSFYKWEELFKSTRQLFDKDGKWSGNYLPVLLFQSMKNCLAFRHQSYFEENSKRNLLEENTDKLAKRIANLVSDREDAVPISLFIASELFRETLQTLERENGNAASSSSRAWPCWMLIIEICKLECAKKWNEVSLGASLQADKMCQIAVKLLAENQHDKSSSLIEEILGLFPVRPEDLYKYPEGNIDQLTTLSSRPDALGYRIISFAFSNSNRVDNFERLWKVAQTAKEVFQFGSISGNENFDATYKANQFMRIVMGVGVSLIDQCMDGRLEISDDERLHDLSHLFRLTFSRALELQEMDFRGVSEYSKFISHLIILRSIAWKMHPRNEVVAVCLTEQDLPSTQYMLATQREVSSRFFNLLGDLKTNGLDYSALRELCSADSEYQFDIDLYMQNARSRNEVDANRKIDLSILTSDQSRVD